MTPLTSHRNPQIDYNFTSTYNTYTLSSKDETRKTYLKYDYLGILSIKVRVNYGSLKRELLDLEVKGLNWPGFFNSFMVSKDLC